MANGFQLPCQLQLVGGGYLTRCTGSISEFTCGWAQRGGGEVHGRKAKHRGLGETTLNTPIWRCRAWLWKNDHRCPQVLSAGFAPPGGIFMESRLLDWRLPNCKLYCASLWNWGIHHFRNGRFCLSQTPMLVTTMNRIQSLCGYQDYSQPKQWK